MTVSASGSRETRRWRKLDSNHRYRGHDQVFDGAHVAPGRLLSHREVAAKNNETTTKPGAFRGTDGSNPVPSSGESGANLTSSSWRVSASIVRITQGEHRADERIASARFSCSDR
jgi:hypothetical protein